MASLPSLPQSRVMAGWLGKLLKLANVNVAETVRINLQTCFPEWTDEQIAAATEERLGNMALLFFEFAQLTHWPLTRLLGNVEKVLGQDILEAAVQADSGVILLVPHFGNWELLCGYLGTHHGVAALYDPPKIEAFEKVIKSSRERFDARLYPIDRAGIRSLMKALKKGELVAVLPDQVPAREGGVYAPFFGHSALTMTLPQKLTARTDAKVLFGSVERSPTGYVLRFEETTLNTSPDEQVDLSHELTHGAKSREEQFAELMNRHIEQIVLRQPLQYQWEYKRFRRPPQGGKENIYRT